MRALPDYFPQLEALLAAPDPPRLVGTLHGDGRGHRRLCDGEEERRKTRMLPILNAWFAHRCMSIDPDPFLAPAKPARLYIRRRA